MYFLFFNFVKLYVWIMYMHVYLHLYIHDQTTSLIFVTLRAKRLDIFLATFSTYTNTTSSTESCLDKWIEFHSPRCCPNCDVNLLRFSMYNDRLMLNKNNNVHNQRFTNIETIMTKVISYSLWRLISPCNLKNYAS